MVASKNQNWVILILISLLLFSLGAKIADIDLDYLKQCRKKLVPIHQRLGRPEPGDWLASHHEEGQTFQEYLYCRPVKPHGKRKTVYIQPMGRFTIKQYEILDLTAEFIRRYYHVKVKSLESLEESLVPKKARRKNPYSGQKQLLTTYIMKKILKPRIPKDAVAYLCITGSDLWPGKGWNFVFGQASLRERVGVWSIYRNGDPDQSDQDYMLCLRRTLKTSSHELGHMFTMEHCILFECNLCGSNSREESDRRDLWLCPECMAKVCWNMKTTPVKRYRRLVEFCRKYGLEREAEFYAKSIAVLDGKKISK